MFGVLSAPIVRSTIKTADAIIGTVHVSVWCGLNPLKDVQGRESISQCHSQTSFSTLLLSVALCVRTKLISFPQERFQKNKSRKR
jgi:hypothetical protein